MTERYGSAEAFRRALEQRLKNAARASNRNLLRERQVLLFERFLVRASADDGVELVVKGGMALELRTVRARTTRDIDVGVMGAPARFEAALARQAGEDLGDYLTFEVGLHRRPELEAAGMKYAGKRFRVQAALAGKTYGDPFAFDVAFGEPILGRPDRIRGRSDLSFVGLETPEFAVYPRATHVAEKLHAYTIPRPTPNSRIKDLPDLAILASVGPLEGSELRRALEQTFGHRNTHALPEAFPAPPQRWREPYRRAALEDGLPWTALEKAHDAAATFLDPVLRGELGVWDAARWRWHAVP
jgi:hypothetical protein